MTEAWNRICSLSDVKPDEIFGGSIKDTQIAVYLVGGKYYATDNVCPHAFSLLSDGWLDGLQVECPLHGAQFNIETGALVRGPATCGIKTYPVRIEHEDIFCLV